ncbi:MAG TPA: hypothetical protein VG605_23925 [Puia sp.]|nr:hypothetical protein [Puia sp.]
MVDTGEDKGLNFAERHWLLLCIFVAILSPLVVHWVQGAAHRESYQESVEQKTVHGGVGGMSPSGGAVAPGDTSRPGSVNPMTPSVQHDTGTTK